MNGLVATIGSSNIWVLTLWCLGDHNMVIASGKMEINENP